MRLFNFSHAAKVASRSEAATNYAPVTKAVATKAAAKAFALTQIIASAPIVKVADFDAVRDTLPKDRPVKVALSGIVTLDGLMVEDGLYDYDDTPAYRTFRWANYPVAVTEAGTVVVVVDAEFDEDDCLFLADDDDFYCDHHMVVVEA